MHESSFEPSVLGSVWKYRWFVALVVLISMGIAVAYSVLSPVHYQATSSLVVEDPRASALFDVGNLQNPQRYVADQAAIIGSAVVAQRAAEIEPSLPSADEVMDRVDVFWENDSNVIDIVFLTTDPNAAVEGANAVATSYTTIRGETTSEALSDALAQLDASISEVEGQLGSLQDQIADQRTEDPSAEALDAQLSTIVARLVEVQAQFQDASEAELEGLREELDDISQQLQTFQVLTNLNDSDPNLSRLVEEQRQTVIRKADLLKRRDELTVDAQLESTGIVVSSPAIVAEQVSSDPVRLAVIGLMVGGLMASAGAYVLALRRRIFIDRSQPQLILDAPLLAEVPDFRSERIRRDLPVRTDPTSVSAEAFRFISAALDLEVETNSISGTGVHLADPRAELIKSFVVVSPSLGDGKTTIAANTALASAREGKRVLAIDADFGHQKLTALMTGNREPEVGITELVLDGLPFDHIVQRIPMPDNAVLDLVARGRAEVAAPDFFRLAGLRTFFEDVRDDYEMIVIDTPPMLHVAYSNLLVRYADRTVVVVRHGQSVSQAEELFNRLAFLETETLGYVYNRAPLRESMVGAEGSLRDVLGEPQRSQ